MQLKPLTCFKINFYFKIMWRNNGHKITSVKSHEECYFNNNETSSSKSNLQIVYYSRPQYNTLFNLFN